MGFGMTIPHKKSSLPSSNQTFLVGKCPINEGFLPGKSSIYITGWWFQTFFQYIGNNNPNWLIFFQRGRYTTNQINWGCSSATFDYRRVATARHPLKAPMNCYPWQRHSFVPTKASVSREEKWTDHSWWMPLVAGSKCKKLEISLMGYIGLISMGLKNRPYVW